MYCNVFFRCDSLRSTGKCFGRFRAQMPPIWSGDPVVPDLSSNFFFMFVWWRFWCRRRCYLLSNCFCVFVWFRFGCGRRCYVLVQSLSELFLGARALAGCRVLWLVGFESRIARVLHFFRSSYFLGFKDPTSSLNEAEGAHLINHVGPKNNSGPWSLYFLGTQSPSH